MTCDMLHNYNYSLLSLQMKTKVVQHVPWITHVTHIYNVNHMNQHDKQSLLSLHLKTNVVQHVPRITHVNHWNHVSLTGSQLLSDLQGTSSINSNVTGTGAVVKNNNIVIFTYKQ